ncbi:MAG TPA: hypothetical protein PLU56_13430 [Sphingorhabdus lacus]|nr:hypothetical protein [Sphingorhabdus lacus]
MGILNRKLVLVTSSAILAFVATPSYSAGGGGGGACSGAGGGWALTAPEG